MILRKNYARLVVYESIIRNFVISVCVRSANTAIEADVGHKTNLTHFKLKVIELVCYLGDDVSYPGGNREGGPRGKSCLEEVKFPEWRKELTLYKRIKRLVPDKLILHDEQIVYPSRVDCSAFLP